MPVAGQVVKEAFKRYKPHSFRLRPQRHRAPNLLNEVFETPEIASGKWQRLYDYNKTAELVRTFATPAERIDFVNPYERDWSLRERKWHRVQHQPLYTPRKAWVVPPLCDYFNALDFYQYITNTMTFQKHIEEYASTTKAFIDIWKQSEKDKAAECKAWNEYYFALNLPVESFGKRVEESLKCTLDGQTEFQNREQVDTFLRRLLDDAFHSLAHTNDFSDIRISHNSRCESFWVRDGFESLYDTYDFHTGATYRDYERGDRFPGDHIQKLGTLTFTMRDEFVAQVRQRVPMKDTRLIDSINSDDWSKSRADIFTPEVYNLKLDAKPLWQCPGYEPESNETHPYGRVAIKNVFGFEERLKSWGYDYNPDVEHFIWELAMTRRSLYSSTALITLFNWLNAQAHCAGYTQFTDDFKTPFNSQLILSDGKAFSFSLYQLQTLAININADWIENKQTNKFISSGSLYSLWDFFEPMQGIFMHRDEKRELQPGLNPIVLQCILKMLLVK